jgi:pimeloyl-ACP methyl ester carboxylesterase
VTCMVKVFATLTFLYSVSTFAVAASIPGIRTAEVRPESGRPAIADILFIHGYGDRLDNHASLFRAWADAGFRVISFDLPSHGESNEWLDFYTFGRLAKLVRRLERETRENDNRPFFLAGWSTGGLIAVRTVQAKHFPKMKRKVSGLILLTPGVSVRLCVGEWQGWIPCKITERTLSSKIYPPHMMEPSPVTPFVTPLFSMNMFFLNSPLAFYESMPKDIPLLVFTADDHLDRYAIPEKTREWVIHQREDNGVMAVGVNCATARHKMDEEPQPESSPIGVEVIETSIMFSKMVIGNNNPSLAHYPLKSCKRF